MDFKDLSPRRDPKGGSPKTPVGGIPMSEYQTYAPLPHQNGSTAWKSICGVLLGLWAGTGLAWITAMQSHGISQKEMEDYVRQSQKDQEEKLVTRSDVQVFVLRNEMHEYVEKYSPWAFDKQTIVGRLATQDQAIGELRTKIELAADVIKKQATKP